MNHQSWTVDLSHALKLLEVEPNGQSIREFRRSFEAGKKQMRLHPQLEALYHASKDLLECDTESFITDWNQCNHQITLGLKTVTLKCTQKKEEFHNALKVLFQNWDPTITPTPANSPTEGGVLAGVLSRKHLKAMSRISDAQLAQVIERIPGAKEQLTNGSLDDVPDSDPMKAIARRLKAVTIKK